MDDNGPMPAPSRTGRPRIYCSDGCRDRAAAIRQAEREGRDRERYQAEQEGLRKARDEEAARRREAEYQRALKVGGDTAAEAKWERLYDETLDEGWYGLCQWALDNGQPGACTRRTRSVYCWRHNRQLELNSTTQPRIPKPASGNVRGSAVRARRVKDSMYRMCTVPAFYPVSQLYRPPLLQPSDLDI